MSTNIIAIIIANANNIVNSTIIIFIKSNSEKNVKKLFSGYEFEFFILQ